MINGFRRLTTTQKPMINRTADDLFFIGKQVGEQAHERAAIFRRYCVFILFIGIKSHFLRLLLSWSQCTGRRTVPARFHNKVRCRASRLSWVPRSAMGPFSRTMISSAFRTALIRWAMISLVVSESSGEGLLDGIFRFHIQCAGGIVQHQDGIVLGDGPRDADALLLTAGEARRRVRR